MKQALIVIHEIQGYYSAIGKTGSPYLKKDYLKKIGNLKRDLKEYCSYKNYNFKKLCNDYKI